MEETPKPNQITKRYKSSLPAHNRRVIAEYCLKGLIDAISEQQKSGESDPSATQMIEGALKILGMFGQQISPIFANEVLVEAPPDGKV